MRCKKCGKLEALTEDILEQYREDYEEEEIRKGGLKWAL